MISLVLIYYTYIVTMTPIIAYFLDLGLRGLKSAFTILEIFFAMTATFFIALTLSSSLLLSLTITLWFFIIPRLVYSLGYTNLGSSLSVILHEILMSLIYYVILRGNLYYVLQSLYFYATDIPSFGLPVLSLVIPAIVEVINSFTFFLMFFPEIVYIVIKRRDMYLLLLAFLIFLEPNIASEMTYAIIPLPYDPIPQFSLIIFILSVSLIIFFSLTLLNQKLSLEKYLTFVTINLIQSISAFYYALTINQIPYAITTIISLILLLNRPFGRVNKYKTPLTFISILPQYFWGVSLVYWYHFLNLYYMISIVPTLILLLFMFFINLHNNQAFLRQLFRRH